MNIQQILSAWQFPPKHPSPGFSSLFAENSDTVLPATNRPVIEALAYFARFSRARKLPAHQTPSLSALLSVLTWLYATHDSTDRRLVDQRLEGSAARDRNCPQYPFRVWSAVQYASLTSPCVPPDPGAHPPGPGSTPVKRADLAPAASGLALPPLP